MRVRRNGPAGTIHTACRESYRRSALTVRRQTQKIALAYTITANRTGGMVSTLRRARFECKLFSRIVLAGPF